MAYYFYGAEACAGSLKVRPYFWLFSLPDIFGIFGRKLQIQEAAAKF